jgi:CheY-like chemotaxis protein
MPKILIVEDYANIQRVYETALIREGYNVTVASDGKEALELVDRYEPDLILLDLLMANVGGLEFLHEYDVPKHPHTKVIVFSNLFSPELAKEARELGANKYLIKSKYTPKELVEVIKETLVKPN